MPAGTLKHFARYKVDGKALLIFDGASCHLDTIIVPTPDQCGIILYCIPSNTTHELQPLNKSIFKSLESCWDDEHMIFKKGFRLTRFTLGPILSKVCAKHRQWIQDDGNLSIRSTQIPGRDLLLLRSLKCNRKILRMLKIQRVVLPLFKDNETSKNTSNKDKEKPISRAQENVRVRHQGYPRCQD
ncbi:hypothetical protein PR048_005426 [Dryococelus australis]|uniref:DDE-1 domain-containing protein n=1 Tax=Dryococelus australis TaxID=614101 RepID=A0ABQ9I843_9NEOP|nr:hypothetical protein PR048_005426 [Dryococelus australis]